MKDGKFAARQRGNQVVLFMNGASPVNYEISESQGGMPHAMSVAKFEKYYSDKFYLVPDPNWKPQPVVRISEEQMAKIKVPTVAQHTGKAKLRAKQEAGIGYTPEALLTVFSSYLAIYRAASTPGNKATTLAIGKFLVQLDPALKEAVKERIQASKEEELEL